ncbi:unnamed protein product [Linum trigynum]|uniref:Reverse transcriptase domain-containing protein n=1 Tax=Linum trigynum TaxID=586398 RepID=A0AAV2CHR2_9ROSI
MRGLGFHQSHCFFVDAVDASGGLVVAWSPGVDASVFFHSNFCICTKINENGLSYVVVSVYISCNIATRDEQLSQLRDLCNSIQLAYVVIGDFNTTLHESEKDGGNAWNAVQSFSLRDFILDLGLHDPGFQGDQFTWTNRRMGDACIRERLDRALCSQIWITQFPETLVKHFTDQGLDHRAILLSDQPYRRHCRPLFRFDARWADNPEVRAMVDYVWKEEIQGTPMFQLWERLKKLRHLLYDWSRAGTTNSLRNIRTLQAEIDQIKLIHPVDWEAVRPLETELNRQWEAEEIYWQQKSRVNWLKKGDQNTSYFHTVTRTRRKKNFVAGLLNDSGDWITDEAGKASLANSFYQHLFTSENRVGNMNDRVANLPIARSVSPEMNAALTATVQPCDVRRTVFAMGSIKAPGSDGFTGKFFKAFWDIVGESVINAVCSFFSTSKILRSFNHTWLTLIPKVDAVENMRQLRPISLCQFIYKVITKIMAERLAELLPNIVSEGQNAFIKERQIVDNVLLGHELMHYLKIKNQGKKGYMALKVDMEKAYDRVE